MYTLLPCLLEVMEQTGRFLVFWEITCKVQRWQNFFTYSAPVCCILNFLSSSSWWFSSSIHLVIMASIIGAYTVYNQHNPVDNDNIEQTCLEKTWRRFTTFCSVLSAWCSTESNSIIRELKQLSPSSWHSMKHHDIWSYGRNSITSWSKRLIIYPSYCILALPISQVSVLS